MYEFFYVTESLILWWFLKFISNSYSKNIVRLSWTLWKCFTSIGNILFQEKWKLKNFLQTSLKFYRFLWHQTFVLKVICSRPNQISLVMRISKYFILLRIILGVNVTFWTRIQGGKIQFPSWKGWNNFMFFSNITIWLEVTQVWKSYWKTPQIIISKKVVSLVRQNKCQQK